VPADRARSRGTISKMMTSGVVALFIGIVLAFFLEYLERTRTNARPTSPSHSMG